MLCERAPMEEKKKRTYIIFDVKPELKTEFKVIAARKNISLAMWAESALLKQLAEDTKYDKK
jgi:predicted HicB family RNase H-like nuclease